MILKLDPKRLEQFVTRNGARFDGFEPEARPTGIPVPMPTTDNEIECVDMYCLDAPSLLRYARVERMRVEHIIFALLGFNSEDYANAETIVAADLGASATEVPSPIVEQSAGDADCG